MITRQEAIRRLEAVTKEITALQKALEEPWEQDATTTDTKAFLDKCTGWEDVRDTEEVIADIYAARTTSRVLRQIQSSIAPYRTAYR